MPKKSGLETPREIAIGARVKHFRDQINWPQPAFAAELGISRDKLASIEYGRTPLRYAVGYQLCFVFDLSHEWLATGQGQLKAATAALELPAPESVSPRSLWSEVSDHVRKGSAPRAKPETRPSGKPAKGELIPRFDARSHVVRFMTDLFAREKFRSPVERQEFALEITSYARELALRIRRERTGERFLAVSPARRGGAAPKAYGGTSGRRSGAASGLRASIRHLEQHLARLNTAMDRANPVSINPSSLPRPTSAEVARLQETIEKIAGQIDAAGDALKILLARRGK